MLLEDSFDGTKQLAVWAIYCLSFKQFTVWAVKCINTLTFKQLTKIDILIKLYSPEDRRHRETQSCELCSISFPLK